MIPLPRAFGHRPTGARVPADAEARVSSPWSRFGLVPVPALLAVGLVSTLSAWLGLRLRFSSHGAPHEVRGWSGFLAESFDAYPLDECDDASSIRRSAAG